MRRAKTDRLFADLLIDQIGQEVLDETAASEITGAFAEAVSLFISRGALRIVYGLDDGEAHLMWGGATRH